MDMVGSEWVPEKSNCRIVVKPGSKVKLLASYLCFQRCVYIL